MVKKVSACIAALAFFFTIGCAATCKYREEFWKYKSQIGTALSIVQAGYPMAVNALGSETDPERVQFVTSKVKIIDSALDVLGYLYFDILCPSITDVEAAQEAAEVALQAQTEIAAVVDEPGCVVEEMVPATEEPIEEPIEEPAELIITE